MSFGERIRYIRGDLSQDDFGYLFGVHRNTVRAWECNEIMPKGGIVKALFMLFNVNLNWLFSGKGEPYLTDLNKPNGNSNPIEESDIKSQAPIYYT